jgi:hypothetical protein
MFFKPIADWIGAGGARIGWRPIRNAARHFAASMRQLRLGKFTWIADTARRSIHEAADRLATGTAGVIRSRFAADFRSRGGTGARAFERLRVLSSGRLPRRDDDGRSRLG